jgi:thioredoxin reductase (NADPH)
MMVKTAGSAYTPRFSLSSTIYRGGVFGRGILMRDLIIIGAGPGGLSASIYAVRAGLDTEVVEKFSPGGQVMNTYEVENYPGFVEPVQGWKLMSDMEEQARRLGVVMANGEVHSIQKDMNRGIFIVRMTNNRVVESRSVIIASGASLRKLGVPGESEFTGRGVSYCATCDAAFFRDKITAVIGGGDTALEEALYLARFASRVYIIHRRDCFRGARVLQDRLIASGKIEPVYDHVVEAIEGDGGVKRLRLRNVKTDRAGELPVEGVFIFVGYDPNTAFIQKELLNSRNEVIVDMDMRTSIEGLFAIGDCRSNSRRQIVMAAADGASASLGAYDYITGVKAAR